MAPGVDRAEQHDPKRGSVALTRLQSLTHQVFVDNAWTSIPAINAAVKWQNADLDYAIQNDARVVIVEEMVNIDAVRN